ncbi:ABC transporter permease [Halosimplex sp. J119]
MIVDQFRDPAVVQGLWQVAAAAVLAAVVIGVVALRGLALQREWGIAIGRGFVQILLMGTVVGLLFSLPFALSGVVLLGMMLGGAWIARSRAEEMPGAFRIATVGIVLGAGSVIVTMTAAGAIDRTVRDLIPVDSMIIANGMKPSSLALDRFSGEVETHRDEIEATLALGVSPSKAVSRYVERSVRAALIPTVDSLRSLGWVWIPGLMAGMIMSGENPVYAAEYQFVVMAMIFGAAGLSSLVCSLVVERYAFTDAQQLKQFDAGPEERA